MADDAGLVNEGIVRIAETGAARGLGVFTKQRVPAGHRVIFERPVLSCSAATLIDASLYYEWTRIGVKGQNELKVLFWKLRLIPSSENPGFFTMRRLKSFVREHAYLQPSDPKRANIYKWCSYLNHACSRCASAEYVVDADTGAISVTTTRPLEAMEEVIVNYNRGRGNFGCDGCVTKRSAPLLGAWHLLRYRFFRWRARMAWPDGVEDPTLFPPDEDLRAPSAGQHAPASSSPKDGGRGVRSEPQGEGGLRGFYLSVLAYFRKDSPAAGRDVKDAELESEADTVNQGNRSI